MRSAKGRAQHTPTKRNAQRTTAVVNVDVAESREMPLHRAAGEQDRSGCGAAGEARFAIRFQPR
jgi:hypothetical protein